MCNSFLKFQIETNFRNSTCGPWKNCGNCSFPSFFSRKINEWWIKKRNFSSPGLWIIHSHTWNAKEENSHVSPWYKIFQTPSTFNNSTSYADKIFHWRNNICSATALFLGSLNFHESYERLFKWSFNCLQCCCFCFFHLIVVEESMKNGRFSFHRKCNSINTPARVLLRTDGRGSRANSYPSLWFIDSLECKSNLELSYGNWLVYNLDTMSLLPTGYGIIGRSSTTFVFSLKFTNIY